MAGLKTGLGFGARRGTPQLIMEVVTLAVALQWCAEGINAVEGAITGRGVVLGPALGDGPGAGGAHSTAGAAGSAAAGDSSPGGSALPPARRRPIRHPRHLRSGAAPDRPGELPSSLGLVAGGGGGGAQQQRRRRALSDMESYVDSTEDCASRMQYTVSACDSHNRQLLVYSYGEGDSELNCGGTPLPESASIKCDHVAWNSGEGIAIVMMAAVGLAVSLCFWVALSRYTKSRTIRVGQPAMCKAFVVGIAVTCLSALALVGANRDLTCGLSLWGYSAGFDLAFGALALKLWSALSSTESSMKFTSVSLSTQKVLAVVTLIVAGDAALLSRWTAVFGDECDAQYDSEGVAYFRRDSCTSCHDGLFWIWIGLKAALVSLSLYINFSARKVESWLGVNGGVGMATYNLAMAGLLVAAVIWAEANAQVRTTTEAVAIVLAGVGALVSILGPKISRAKLELEGKAVVGPSAIVADPSGGIEALLGGGPGGAGGAGGAGGYNSSSERGDGEGRSRPQTSTLSGLSSAGLGGGGSGGLDHSRKGSGRRRRPLARQTAGGGSFGGIALPVGLLGSNKSTHTISPDVYYDDGSLPIPSPLPPREAAAFATATTAAALLDQGGNGEGSSSGGGGGGRGKRRHVLEQPRPKAPPAASVICTRPDAGLGGSSGSGSGSVGGGGRAGGVFATTGGSVGTRLIKPDPSGFWTPPRLTRRSRSGAEISTRSADAMALAAAAAGAAERKAAATAAAGVGETAVAGAGGDEHGGVEGARKTLKEGLMSSWKSGRNSGSVGDRRTERIPSSRSVSGLGVGEKEARRGGGSGSTTASQGGGGQAKAASGASESSMASRASSRRQSVRSRSHSHSQLTYHSSGKSSRKSSKRQQAASTSGGSVGGDSNSARSSRDKDSWACDPIIMAINGYGLGAGGLKQTYSAGALGGSGHAQKRKSSGSTGGGGGGGGGPRGSGLWSSGPRRGRSGASASRDRVFSVGSSSTVGGGGGRRSSAPNSLVMHAETGTRLHCPHCEKEVAGCGFKGCSGSLVRPPSFSDDEFGPELFVAPPLPPPTLPPLVPAVLGGYTPAAAAAGFGAGGGSLGLPSWGGSQSAAAPGGTASGGGGGGGVVLSPSTQYSGSMQDNNQAQASSSAAAAVTSSAATRPQPGDGGGSGSGAPKSLSTGAGSRLRMSFRRGPSPCDTFDNESDSSDLVDDYDDDESQRSALGIYSPTSSSLWA